MLWREGNTITYQIDECHVFTCPTERERSLQRLVLDWLFDMAEEGFEIIDTVKKLEQHYQSFLLDYIEYLFAEGTESRSESAIDKQLEEPIKSDIGVLRYVRENPDNLPVLETPSLTDVFRVPMERRPYERGERSPEPCREADSCGCSRDGCPGNPTVSFRPFAVKDFIGEFSAAEFMNTYRSMEPIGIEQSWFTQSWPGSYV